MEKRSFCDSCERPAKVCLCSTFPRDTLVESPLRVILLQHPQERKQKHQSVPFLFRTIADVYLVVGKKLGVSAVAPGAAPDGKSTAITLPVSKNSISLWAQRKSKEVSVEIDQRKGEVEPKKPEQTAELKTEKSTEETITLDVERTAVLFPSDRAMCAGELCKSAKCAKINTIVVLDATWTFAKQMYRDCPILSKLPTATLEVTDLPEPRFLVRKPEKIKGTEVSTLGHSTAEAVAIFLDQYNAAVERVKSSHKSDLESMELATATVDRPATAIYDAVCKPLDLYVQFQLEFTGGNVKHRTDRKDYVPNMYESVAKRPRLDISSDE